MKDRDEATFPLDMPCSICGAIALEDCFAGEGPEYGPKRTPNATHGARIMGTDSILVQRQPDGTFLARPGPRKGNEARVNGK